MTFDAVVVIGLTFDLLLKFDLSILWSDDFFLLLPSIAIQKYKLTTFDIPPGPQLIVLVMH